MTMKNYHGAEHYCSHSREDEDDEDDPSSQLFVQRRELLPLRELQEAQAESIQGLSRMHERKQAREGAPRDQ